MQPKASHLYRSRHGIWYFRWRVPEDIRKRHPGLPKELKRSTKTADTRHARAMARRLLCALLLRFGTGNDMSHPFRYSGWTLKRDPATDRITELTVGPEDTPEMLARLDRVLDIEAAHAARAAPPAVSVIESVSIGEAIERYRKLQLQTGAWTENTFTHTHGPSLRLFRELVGRATKLYSKDGEAHTTVDLPLLELTHGSIEQFIDDFWRFPAQQGKRSEGTTARDILTAGGPPQSRANVFKRLAHVRQFLVFCCDKNFIQRELLREIELVLAKDTARAREKASVAFAGPDGVVADGYVAFTREDIKAMFGPAFLKHANKNAARYWIPLLGLFAGLRVGEASQLRPSDFEVVDGIECLRVSGETVGHALSANSQRVKTLASLRQIPIHPMLAQLGLLDYARQRLEAGESWMWDGLLWTSKSGYGKYPSRDFQKLAEKVGVYQPRRKVFHSFRSTIAQELESCGLEGELIDRFLGHETKTIRGKNYGRTENGRSFPVRRVFDVLNRVTFEFHPVFKSGN